ncbi:Glycosyl transferase, group 2 family protein [Aurantiacibacter gangjinensis]|nr:Glycosyl transferase, group 2 family protein [Aurantiacibacter gangjinensis]
MAMSVYNGARFLAPAIESVLAQSFTDFEFLILDDGSGDGTAAILADYAARDARIRPIIRENRGLIASLNQLLDEARSPLVARMDADDICLPDRFAKQVAFLSAHPDHSVVGCWAEDIDEDGRAWPVQHPDHPLMHTEMEEALREGRSVLVHPAVMYRRDLVRRVGGYHAAFRHCEDFDLWLRLANQTKMANLPERLLRYRHYAGQVSKRHATEQAVGAAIAREAWRVRGEGKADPTASLDTLPPIEELDMLFGESGVAQRVRGRAAFGLLHSRSALTGDGLDLIIRHVREGGAREGLWRTAARLVRFGQPLRAARLSAALLAA